MKNTIDYLEIWMLDRQGMLETMKRNLYADLQAGYNPKGNCIQTQLLQIAEYEYQTAQQIEKISAMVSDSQVQRYCKMDLLKRGAIEL